MRTILIAAFMLVSASASAQQSYFAHVGPDGVVDAVIAATQTDVNRSYGARSSEWVQTSKSGGLRKNFAGVGYVLDRDRNVFTQPKPFPSWSLDEATARWKPPVPKPNGDEPWKWDEKTQTWVIGRRP